MNNTWKVSKYVFHDYKKSMLVYYGVILGIFILMTAAYLKISAEPNSRIEFSGFGFSAVVFLFISGLNSFKAYFKFMQANNVSRKRFFLGTMVILILMAALMASVDAVCNVVFKQLIPYEGLFTQVFKMQSFFTDILWSFSLMAFAVSSGWFITMLYYRCNKVMKLVVSFAPVFTFILLGIIDRLSMGIVQRVVKLFLAVVLGSPYLSIVYYLLCSVVAFGLCYILIRRMPIKD